MDVVLMSITGISLLLAIVMGLVVFRLLREERERSEARVALLRNAVGEAVPLELFESEAAADSGPHVEIARSRELFGVSEGESPWPRRAAIAAVLAVVVSAGGYLMLGGGTRQGDGPTPIPSRPLELLALQHTQDADALTITGTLMNPRNGATVDRITATAFLLAADGRVLATARAPLDYQSLAPGDESDFVIRVPVGGAVSRYRVGFRRADGSVVTHVDRRSEGSSARHSRTTENAPWLR